MSLEQQIEALTAAVNANTQAILGNAGTASTVQNAPAAPLLAPAPFPAAAPVPSAAAIPPAAHAIPPAAAPAAAASPSNVVYITLDQLKQEVTAAYAAASPEKQAAIAGVIQNQFGLVNLDAAPADQYNNIINAVRAL